MTAGERKERFLRLVLEHRGYEDDAGGRQPSSRYAMVAGLRAVYRRQISEEASVAFLGELLTAPRDDTRALLTYEDALAIGLLAARLPREPGSGLDIAATLTELVWTRMMQSDTLRREMGLDDGPERALLSLREVGEA